jgi:hypothetical protein
MLIIISDESLVEEQESIDLLAESRNQMPNISTLCSRLKPKIVQDPFTDNQGNPLSEHTILK